VKPKADGGSPRITQQYRDRDRRMVYEVTYGSSLLVLLASESAGGPQEWRFEAHPRESPQLVVAGQWGASRADAFRTMRDLWIERRAGLGLARIEWDKVAVALAAVRAI
jgi:hypothetical protein